jgi:hypothetical protein
MSTTLLNRYKRKNNKELYKYKKYKKVNRMNNQLIKMQMNPNLIKKLLVNLEKQMLNT